MIRGSSRTPVLPRHTAAAVIVASCARCGWATGIVILLMAALGLVATLAERDRLDLLAVPLIALAVMAAAIAWLASRPSNRRIVGYLVVGTLCLWVYQWALLSGAPQLQAEALFVLNRPALALVLVGTATASPLSAVAWGFAGFVAGEATMILLTVQLGLRPLTGVGPTIALVNYAAVFLAVALVHRSQRRHLPDLARLRADTRQQEVQRGVDRRASALVHDTVLNDLVALVNGPSALSDRARARLHADLNALAAKATIDGSPEIISDDMRDIEFRESVRLLASDFQWRGLSVDVALDSHAQLGVSRTVAAAALGAARACLENVLRHSQVDSAELIVGADDDRVTVMVVDAGVGFDPVGISPDRLGLRASVTDRVTSAGGTVKIWSAPGDGTSVMISLPVTADTSRQSADA